MLTKGVYYPESQMPVTARVVIPSRRQGMTIMTRRPVIVGTGSLPERTNLSFQTLAECLSRLGQVVLACGPIQKSAPLPKNGPRRSAGRPASRTDYLKDGIQQPPAQGMGAWDGHPYCGTVGARDGGRSSIFDSSQTIHSLKLRWAFRTAGIP